MHKSDRNTIPVPRPEAFGDVMHIDIVFGPEISIGNVHYGLLITDRYSRMSYVYPLQNLRQDIRKQLECFFAHIGMVPKRLISDFDMKLIGGSAREYLNSLLVHVNAASATRQDRNGLVERHWQTMVSMARNWLASVELPPSFWFYAIRRAAEVCNYFPCKQDEGTFITPFELVHHQKPDLRVLFKMFGLAAVRRERQGDCRLQKFESQSIPMIAVGRCQNSNGIQFYNPANGTFVSSIDYKFQYNVTSGTKFGYSYQPGTIMHRLDETTTVFAPTFPLDSTVLVHSHSPPHIATVIGTPSYDRPDIYTVAFRDGSIAEYSESSNILEASPTPSPISPNLLPHWLQDGVNSTLFLFDMPKPRHGKLYKDTENQWMFYPAKTQDISKGILLSDLSANYQVLLDTGQLFKGHKKFDKVYHIRNQLQLQDCVL